MPVDVVIFDLDGTLVDTNALHVEAWVRALRRHGYTFGADRIWVEVGKGGDQLIPSLLGEEIERREGEALRKAQPEELRPLAEERGIRPFEGAREVLEELRRRGVRTCLATSSNKKQLGVIEQLSGVKWSEEVDAVVTADDAERSKPHPDLVVAAVKKMGLEPTQCVMVGDTLYDALAAKHAGVVCVGLETGHNKREQLRAAGARVVYGNVAELRGKLEEALKVASPGRVRMDRAAIERLMRAALEAAEEGMENGEAPIGCVVANGDGGIVATGYNQMNSRQDKIAHAEIVTLSQCAGEVPLEAKDLILVSTLEPCVMCTGAAMEAGVDVVLYGLKAPPDAGTGRVEPPVSPESQMPRIVGGILAKESRALLARWYEGHKGEKQAEYVGQLLDSTK